MSFLLSALCLIPFAPDEVRLHDGRVLHGTVRTVAAGLEVTTRTGVVTVAKAAVDRVRTDAELRAELRALAGRVTPTPFARMQLARHALGVGLPSDAFAQLEPLVEATGEPIAALANDATQRARLDTLLREIATEWLPMPTPQETTEARVRAILAKVDTRTTPAVARGIELTLAAMDRTSLRPLLTAAQTSTQPNVRYVAVRALAHEGPRGASCLWRASVIDPDARIRALASQSTVARGDADRAADDLATGLVRNSPQYQVRTAQALGRLPGARAEQLLASLAPQAIAAAAAAPSSAPGGSIRAHMAVLEQVSYIRDFDVEVAMGAAIANPKVDVLTHGAVLDVTVLGTSSQRVLAAIRGSLRGLVGADPGANPNHYGAWLAARRTTER